MAKKIKDIENQEKEKDLDEDLDEDFEDEIEDEEEDEQEEDLFEDEEENINEIDEEEDVLDEGEKLINDPIDQNLTEESKFSKIKEIFRDKKKLGLIAAILLVFCSGIYFMFFKKNKSELDGEKKSVKIEEQEENPYRINENLLNELPEIKIKAPKEEKKEIVDELLKNNDILSLKIENELKIPERKIVEPPKPPEIPLPVKEEKKPVPLPMPPSANLGVPSLTPQITPAGPVPVTANIIDESTQRKIDANVIVFAGSEKSQDNKEDVLALINGKRKTKKSSFATISESYVGYKDRMILAGKIIDLVLETSINTEQEGMVRGIVASDVYSESGFNILIPAGSRVLGKYAPVLKYGNFRVNIMFSRIVRPDGVDIILGDMKAVNKLGATGARADRVDNRIGSAFGNSILIGALSLATLFASREIENLSETKTKTNAQTQGTGNTVIVINPNNNGNSNDNNNNDGRNNEYGSATRDIIEDAIEPLKKHLEKLQSEQTPILFINQGRKVSIMTDKDIVFNDENAFVFYPEESDELGLR